MAKQITESFPEERDDIILDVLKRQGKIRVTEVCDILSIAPSTARLLLQSMQEKGLLQRTHGGAIPVDIPEQTKPNRDFSEIENYEAKLKLQHALLLQFKMEITLLLEAEQLPICWQRCSITVRISPL